MAAAQKSGRKRPARRKAPAASKHPAARARTARSAPRREPLLATQHRRDLAGLLLIAAGLFAAGVLWLGWEGGRIGAWIDAGAHHAIGNAANVLPVLAVAIGGLMLARSELVDAGPFRAGLCLLVPSILLAFGGDQLGLGDGSAPTEALTSAAVIDHGGWAGGLLYFCTHALFGGAGTTIVCVLGLLLGLLFATGSTVQAAMGWWSRRIGTAAVSAGQHTMHAATAVRQATGEQLEQARQAAATRGGDDAGLFDGGSGFPDLFGDVPAAFAHVTLGDEPSSIEADGTDRSAPTTAPATTPASGRRTGRRRSLSAKQPADDDQLVLVTADEADAPTPAKPSDEPPQTVLRARVEPASLRRGEDGYILPSTDLLVRGTGVAAARPGEVERMSRLLEETFGHFGIQARVVGMVPGPRVSRYELSLAPGTKMSKVEGLRKDLSYALATTEIRILAPIPGKSAVGIEVENASPTIVTLGDIHTKKPKGASPLFVWFGKDITGDTVGADLAKMPHLLVAGTTGAGKSGCMNALLSSIVLGATPDEVKLLLIDPKKVELSTYEGLPHLLTPVVTNMKKAANALGNVVAQMEERYSSMEIAGARTLPEYNKIRVKRGDAAVPYVLVIIDELADLVMQAKSDVEDAVIRVAQKGRAAGFHLVLATQRPSVDVITGMIKSNVPSRIAFAVSSQTDSRVILDQNGAETLLGSGDMLFKPVWARSPQRVQGAWISESEVRALCDAARQQREPEFDIDLLAEPEPVAAEGDAAFVDQDDRIAEAVRLVAEFQTCSASFFQRRMRVGYTRGARLVDMLERRGWVAPGEGPRPRNVLITTDDLPHILAELGGELISASGDD